MLSSEIMNYFHLKRKGIRGVGKIKRKGEMAQSVKNICSACKKTYLNTAPHGSTRTIIAVLEHCCVHPSYFPIKNKFKCMVIVNGRHCIPSIQIFGPI